MDPNRAIAAHLDWKLKLRGAINNQEKVEAETLSRDTCCDLGKWLHGDAKAKLGLKAEYTALVSKHRDFHREAGRVANMINAKHYEQASKALEAGSAYASASSAVGGAIKALQKVMA